MAQAAPALGGIATFAQLIVADPTLNAAADVSLLNTTRVAVREAGVLSFGNLRNAVDDVIRVWRAGRRSDVVHLQVAPGRVWPLARTLALCTAARISGSRVLCHVHSGRINGGSPDGFHPSKTYLFLLRRLRFCDAILTVSDAGTRTLRGLLPTARVETVNNAVDVAAFAPADPARSPVRFVFVGTLSRRKGVAELVAAAARLRERLPDGWTLDVVGGAAEVGEPEAESLRTAAREAGFGDSLLGGQPADKVRAILAESSVLVLPSHWEGQPMVILEAMASGLPVLSTSVGAIPDVVRDGQDGLVIPPHDVEALVTAMETLVRDPELRARLGASAHQRALERHDMPVLAERLLAFYRGSRG